MSLRRCILVQRSTSLTLWGLRCWHQKVVRYKLSSCWMISTARLTTPSHATTSTRSYITLVRELEGPTLHAPLWNWQKMFNIFQTLGEKWGVSGNILVALEEFTCQMYKSAGVIRDVDELRQLCWFLSVKEEKENCYYNRFMAPGVQPTSMLREHIKRVNYQVGHLEKSPHRQTRHCKPICTFWAPSSFIHASDKCLYMFHCGNYTSPNSGTLLF